MQLDAPETVVSAIRKVIAAQADNDTDPVSRPERQERLHLSIALRCHIHRHVLGDDRKDNLAFHQRELVSDTDPLAAAEGHVREPRQRCFTFRKEAIGIETQGVFEEAGITVRRPGATNTISSLRTPDPSIDVSARRGARNRETPGGGAASTPS